MFVTERYNDIPKHILDRIPKLQGQTVKFVGKGKYYDKNNNTWKFPYMMAIPKTDRIVDPEDNSVYTIANVHNISSSGDEIMPLITFDQSNAGHIIIRPDSNGRYSPSDILTYEYLMLCNYNESNPFRDKSAKAYFEEVNDAKVAEDKITARLNVAEIVKTVATLTDDEVLLLSTHLGIGEEGDALQIIRMKLLDFAEKDPTNTQNTIAKIGSYGKFVLDVKKAIDLKVISRDGRNNSFKWTDGKQEFFAADKGLTLHESIIQLAKWMSDTSDGSAVYTTIKKSID